MIDALAQLSRAIIINYTTRALVTITDSLNTILVEGKENHLTKSFQAHQGGFSAPGTSETPETLRFGGPVKGVKERLVSLFSQAPLLSLAEWRSICDDLYAVCQGIKGV